MKILRSFFEPFRRSPGSAAGNSEADAKDAEPEGPQSAGTPQPAPASNDGPSANEDGTVVSALAHLEGQLNAFEERFAALQAKLEHEQGRLDYALGELEGLAPLREAFFRARKTEGYQQAFTEKQPLVTVCITTYNRATLLVERAIQSLRTQSYRNLQILVVGDCCTDDTGRQLAAVNDSRIEFHNLEQRQPYPRPGRDRWHVAGTYPGNAARQFIRGRFITHLDDDDTYDPDRVQILVEAAQQNRADFLWHKFWHQQPDSSWMLYGSEKLERGQVGLGMIFYHAFFLQLPADIYAYRAGEPGDWNRIRRIKYFRPNMKFIDRPLTYYHYRDRDEEAVISEHDEGYLD